MSVFFISVFVHPLYSKDFAKPSIMLANVYHQGIDLDHYWVSEKYDGVRAYWDGEKLLSRGGNVYHAPKWFIQGFPKQKLDGELWISRQSFELLVSTVRDAVPDNSAWKKVKFMVFDLPDLNESFDMRLVELNKTIDEAECEWLKVVKQWKVNNHQTLMRELAEITKAGAEGLMLHRGASLYKGRRSGDLLKVKAYEDAEAIVVRHIQGKGKFKNMLGAIVVEMPDTTRFKIGTGFSNEERKNPPPIGVAITYQFRGKTKNGIPRFASFLRIRNAD
jgi:DNA ligase-1